MFFYHYHYLQIYYNMIFYHAMIITHKNLCTLLAWYWNILHHNSIYLMAQKHSMYSTYIIEVIWHHSRICKCHCVCICNKIIPHKNISIPMKNTWEFKNHRKKIFYHAMFISNKISSIFQNHVQISNHPCNSWIYHH